MNKLTAFIIGVVLPTILIWIWLNSSMICYDSATNYLIQSTSGPSPIASLVVIIFAIYAAFYILTVILSGYKVTKKK